MLSRAIVDGAASIANPFTTAIGWTSRSHACC